MKRSIIIETNEHMNAVPTGRWTCLKCGYASHVSIYLRSLDRKDKREFVFNPEHECAPRGVGADHEHWREVVRDAFLTGRDAEAIELICHQLNLVPP